MVLGSFKPAPEFLRIPPTWIPEAPTLDNYRRLFEVLDFPRFFFNSAVVAVAVTGGNLVFCSMVGYALAKLKFVGRNQLFLLVLATLMIPGSVTVIPLYILMSMLGLTNSFGGLILPFLATAFGVFLMRQFMLGIPDELLEAARIDGASEVRIFFQVVMPLATPALATLGILTFLGSWNSFFWPLIVASEDEMFTLPVALATFATGAYQADHGLLMAGSLVIVLPVLIVFILLQRLFTEGIATTGIKG
ncbi:MAG: carbohydrate ABC transporter permease [Chloroflexi bacterium]|nr:carbohydrate ABC transporter permease [Chloroflexota bacterium]